MSSSRNNFKLCSPLPSRDNHDNAARQIKGVTRGESRFLAGGLTRKVLRDEMPTQDSQDRRPPNHERRSDVFVSCSTLPPRGVLLLQRCTRHSYRHKLACTTTASGKPRRCRSSFPSLISPHLQVHLRSGGPSVSPLLRRSPCGHGKAPNIPFSTCSFKLSPTTNVARTCRTYLELKPSEPSDLAHSTDKLTAQFESTRNQWNPPRPIEAVVSRQRTSAL